MHKIPYNNVFAKQFINIFFFYILLNVVIKTSGYPNHRYMCVIEKRYTKDTAIATADCLGRRYCGRNNV
jgi:hypothetical protein